MNANANASTVSMNDTRARWQALDNAVSAANLAAENIRRDFAGIDPTTPLDWSNGYTVADLIADADHYHGHTVGGIDRLDYLPPLDGDA